MHKFLIIRLSSLGDIIQCLPSADHIRTEYPESQIHWLVKSDFSPSLESSKSIDRLIVYNKKLGLMSFMSLCWKLRAENYTHVYDAHSNLRSHIASYIILNTRWNRPLFIRRSKERLKRWLLFTLRWNLLPKPYRAIYSFLTPLEKWGLKIPKTLPEPNLVLSPSIRLQELIAHLNRSDFILAAPSAAWELKRWPSQHWSELIKMLPEKQFVLVGGPEDAMCSEIAKANPLNCTNLSGQLSWAETFELVQVAGFVISGDTGVLHMADYLKKKLLAIIGPTAFGFPSRDSSLVIEKELPCRPCTKDGRGKCSNSEYKKCLVDITPDELAQKIRYT